LSGGQRQRVGIARCLAREQPLLLLDEPFSALDPALRKEMLRLIAKLNKEHDITVLMVTHNPDDALQIADNIAFIENGKVALHAPTTILADDNAPDMLKRYLGK
jgi:thiamine transport system ATP-binding protein